MRDPADGRAVTTTRRGDRALGAVALAGSAWLWWEAGTLDGGFGDPVGPAAFPRLVAVPTGLLALLVLLRPDADARWWHGRQTLLQLAALAALLLYPAALEPLGFPLATALGAAALALVMGAGPARALAVGVVAGPGLQLVFSGLLGLPLPAWPGL